MFNAQQIHHQLNGDIAACEALLKLLEAEREALAARDMVTLDTIIEQKATTLATLEQSARVRSEWLREYVQTSPEAGATGEPMWDSLLAGNAPALVQSWQRLKDLQIRCRAENEVNGKIIARNQKTYARLLDIVRGQTTAPNLYSASGKSTGGGYSNKVGEA